jgi:hypothetical protein
MQIIEADTAYSFTSDLFILKVLLNVFLEMLH